MIVLYCCVQPRSDQRRYTVRKGVLRNFANFTGKHQSLFFNRVAGLQAEGCNFIEKETLEQVSS